LVSKTRPVSFGNPALGTYNGIVYTVPHTSDGDGNTPRRVVTTPLVEGAESVDRMVAMVSVPPEHVPEGVLSLIRSHLPFIEHVRVVIEEPNYDDQDQEEEDLKRNAAEGTTDLEDGKSGGRAYLVLLQMTSEEDAVTFIEDLDGRPYLAFDDQDVCSVEHVVALRGEDGVSLLSPHFAPSMSIDATGRALEILPSSSAPSSSSPSAASAAATVGMAQTTTVPESESSPPSSGGNKAAHFMDDQNCAVCLEHLALHPDDHTAGKTSILTTVCNHTFHLDCLDRWSGPCFVCRFDHSGLNETLSQCHVCGTTEHNYVCLICGVVSCVGMSASAADRVSHVVPATSAGRHRPNGPSDAATAAATAHRFYTSHAGQHYNETLHAYALDTSTQHVYDFAGQGYVHRLVQNKEDGKLVEINDPFSNSQERSLTPGLSDAQEGEVVHRKLEGFASQYYTLLKSQLEQQRTFYEGRLQEIRREFAVKERNDERSRADFISVLRQERKQLAHRLVSIQRKKEKALDGIAFLKSMNESLESNQPALQVRIQQAQRERIESREMIQNYLPRLEEKVTTLMLQLEESMGNGSVPR
jgi:BRCA1-associated protein